MPRYTRINDEDQDDDSVALMLGQEPPRLSRFGRGAEYIQLEDLERDGETEEQDRKNAIHERFQKVRRSSHNLVVIVLGVAFTIVIVAACVSVVRRRHMSSEDDSSPIRESILQRPLPESTKFSNGTHNFKRSTIMVSLDGMHPHYISEDRTPRLHKLVGSGFSTPFIRPSFPSQTFPNHWTLVTGMYPMNHGIVGNTFYDSELGLEFVNVDPKKSLDRRFWGGEPLWATAKRHGVSSAVHMWPGSEVDWGTNAPDEVGKFDPDETLDAKLDVILQWLDRETPPQLMLSYVPTIDQVGHHVGISGPELFSALLDVDKFVGKLVDGIAARNLTEIVNLVIVSDHGMSPTSNERLIFLDDIVENYANVTSNRGWPLAGLRFPSEEDVDKAYNSAMHHEKEGGNSKHYKVYRSNKMPYHWHFGTEDKAPDSSSDDDENTKRKGQYSHRIAPLYIVPDPGYSLLTHKDWDEMGHNYFLKGVHGYDNDAPLMRAVFLAQGPAFPAGKYRPFDNVDVYSAVCRSLGFVESSESDGDFEGVQIMSKATDEHYPGVDFDTPVFKGSSFASFYETSQ